MLHLGQGLGGVAHAVGRPAQVPGDEEQGRHAVHHCGGGAQGDQRVHVGGAVPQGLEAHGVVFAVDEHNGQGQQELDHGHHQGVGRLVEEGGQGPAHHVAHGDIEQGRQEHQRGEEAALHAGGLLRHDVSGPGYGGRGRLARRSGEGGAVARLLHGVDDLVGGGLVGIFHQHGVAQQVDVAGLHAGHAVHGLLHMGGAGCAGHACYIKFLLHRIHQAF